MPKTVIPLASAVKVLGLKLPFTDTQLKQAYRQAAKRSHPDAKGSNEAFVAVNESYNLLKNYVGVAAIPTPSYSPFPSPPTYSPKKQKQSLSKEEKLQRHTAKMRNQFQRDWKIVFKSAHEESRKGINLKAIGRVIDAFWRISSLPLYFDPAWFYQALFTGNAGKAKKEKYRALLILVAPCDDWNDKFNWAQRYFALEFGHEFIL